MDIKKALDFQIKLRDHAVLELDLIYRAKAEYDLAVKENLDWIYNWNEAAHLAAIEQVKQKMAAVNVSLDALLKLAEIKDWAYWSNSQTDSVQYAKAQADVQKILGGQNWL